MFRRSHTSEGCRAGRALARLEAGRVRASEAGHRRLFRRMDMHSISSALTMFILGLAISGITLPVTYLQGLPTSSASPMQSTSGNGIYAFHPSFLNGANGQVSLSRTVDLKTLPSTGSI